MPTTLSITYVPAGTPGAFHPAAILHEAMTYPQSCPREEAATLNQLWFGNSIILPPPPAAVPSEALVEFHAMVVDPNPGPLQTQALPTIPSNTGTSSTTSEATIGSTVAATTTHTITVDTSVSADFLEAVNHAVQDALAQNSMHLLNVQFNNPLIGSQPPLEGAVSMVIPSSSVGFTVSSASYSGNVPVTHTAHIVYQPLPDMNAAQTSMGAAAAAVPPPSTEKEDHEPADKQCRNRKA